MSGRGGVARAWGSAAVPVCASNGCVRPWKSPSLVVGSELLLPTDPTVLPVPWQDRELSCSHSAGISQLWRLTPRLQRRGGWEARAPGCGIAGPFCQSCLSSDCW